MPGGRSWPEGPIGVAMPIRTHDDTIRMSYHQEQDGFPGYIVRDCGPCAEVGLPWCHPVQAYRNLYWSGFD